MMANARLIRVLVALVCFAGSPALHSSRLHIATASADDGGDGGDGGDDGGDDGDGGTGDDGDDGDAVGIGDEFGFDAYGLDAFGIVDVSASSSSSIGTTANGIGDAVEATANAQGYAPDAAQAMGTAAAIAAQDAIDAGKSPTEVGIEAAAAAGAAARGAGYDTGNPDANAQMGAAIAGAMPCC